MFKIGDKVQEKATGRAMRVTAVQPGFVARDDLFWCQWVEAHVGAGRWFSSDELRPAPDGRFVGGAKHADL